MRELIGADRVPTLRVFMADVPIMMCDLLKDVFGRVSDRAFIEPNNLRQLLTEHDNGSIDVVIVGSSGSNETRGTIDVINALAERHKIAKIIVLTHAPDYNEIIALFRAGARGVLCGTDLRVDLLCKCVRCVHDGQIWAANEYLEHLVTFLSKPAHANVTDSQGRSLLTAREQQVLHLLAGGLSNCVLAATPKLSEHTGKNHLFRIYDKLGELSRVEEALFALTPRCTTSRVQKIPNPTELRPAQKLRIVKAG